MPRRLLRGLAALLFLVGALGGVPAALLALAGNPLPSSVNLSLLKAALLSPDDGSILIRVVALVAWVAWAGFAVSVLVEIVQLASGLRIRVRLPGLGGSQRLVAGLLLSVLSMVATSQVGPAHAVAPRPPLSTSQQSATSSSATGLVNSATAQDARATLPAEPETASSPAQPHQHLETHLVERGDDLWDLAVRYYGQGRDWRRIAAANPDRLSGGPDRLQPGWRLSIPEPRKAPDTPSNQLPQAESGSDDLNTVVVRPGDSLSSIAEKAYGDAARWTSIYHANRAQLSDPDELQIGIRLVLPSRAAPPPVAAHPPTDTAPPAGTSQRTQTNNGTTTTGAATGETDRHAQERRDAHPDPDHAGEQNSSDGPTAEQPTTDTSLPSSDTPVGSQPGASGDTTAQPERLPGPQGEGSTADRSTTQPAPWSVAAVGGLLAASVVGGLRRRRRAQLQTRPLGRRILAASGDAQDVETALGDRQSPSSLESLDLALRAIAAHCHQLGVPLPSLALAKIGSASLELVMGGLASDAPVGFSVRGQSWLLKQADVSYLRSVPGIERAARPYPALVSVGRDEQDQEVLVDLEAAALFSVGSGGGAFAERVLLAMAAQLALSPWADEMVLTVVGPGVGLPEALDRDNVTGAADLDEVLDQLEERAALQREHGPHRVLGQHRVDPDLAEPWAPEVILVNQRLSPAQEHRMAELFTSKPRTPMAAVVMGPVKGATMTLEQRSELPDGNVASAVLQPFGLVLAPQLLGARVAEGVVELLTATGSEDTEPAPWWVHGEELPSGRPPDNVTYLGKRFGGWGSEGADGEGAGQMVQEPAGAGGDEVHHPTLRLLGPVELTGARGTLPPRAGKQCLEYCGWLLEHPGTTAQAMAAALFVAEGTRRSNMSRLRAWLGVDPHASPYLPDAYTGRIVLHSAVSSDWQRLQIITAGGLNRTSTEGLTAALQLVRGAPLADAAPGQWHWAEELRTDMISVVRDIGVELTTRALDSHDIDLARWAAARALAAAPGDELLTVARIRTEHRAGNTGEVERLTLQLAAHARSLGLDLNDETVLLLQQVMEGTVRARLA